MKDLRKIQQNKLKGDIYLHSMPGLNEDLTEIMDLLKIKKIDRIICLTDKKEIQKKSPEYLPIVESGRYDDIIITYNPNPDFGLPETSTELDLYNKSLQSACNTLNKGNILIHCRGGVGRTGTFAAVLLRKLGYSFEKSIEMVNEAGSNPGTPVQSDFVRDYSL